MRSRSRVFVFFVLIAASGLAGAGADVLEKPTTKGNVTIQLPAGWTTGSNGLISAQAPQPDKDSTGTFQASLLITKSAGTRVDAAAEQANVARKIKGYQATEEPVSFVSKSGTKGVLFGGTSPSGMTRLRSRQYMFVSGEQIYTVTITCLASRWAAYQPTLDECMATLVIK